MLVMFGCQAIDRSATITHQAWDEWAVGQVVDARTGLAVPMQPWLEGLATYDVIYLGEEHHNRSHIDAALTVLRSLMSQGRRPWLAMEMFGWDGQPALDRYLRSEKIVRSEFLEQVSWKQNWGGAFEDYEPLAQFAKDQRLPLLAMNPPKSLIRQVVKHLPRLRQSLFFSATMPDEIGKLAAELLTDPVRVAVTPVATTVELIRQRVEFMNPAEKNAALAEALRSPEMTRSLVFTRTKHGADKVVRYLEQQGIAAAAIHGNKSQSNRERALASFKKGEIKVLVATDIAARGIDIDAVSHVINYHLPNIPESYVHRIGRTARAGASGIAISYCDNEERAFLRDIERLIRIKIDAVDRRGQIVANSANLVAPESVTLKPHELRRQQPRGGAGQRPAQGKPGGARPQHARSGKPGGHGKPAQGHGKPHGGRSDERRGGQPHRGQSQGGASRPAMPTEPYRPAAHANGEIGAMAMMRPVRLPE